MDFLKLLRSGRVIVWDGGFGTSLSLRADPNVSAARCNEELNLIAPLLIQSIHEDFLKAGSQVIETNTFGANRVALAEHGLADKVREINLAAVRIAREATKQIPPPPPLQRGGDRELPPLKKGGRGGFISGSIGPTSKLPTLGHISFDEMVDAYREQALALIEGGVDILQIETCQDILQAKAAAVGCKEAIKTNPPSPPFYKGGDSCAPPFSKGGDSCAPPFSKGGDSYAPPFTKGGTGGILPIIITITLERSGTTLLGTEVGAALAALAPLGISAFGLNCGTGPAEMEDALRFLSRNSPLPIIIKPNAGLPEIKNGVAHYNLGPAEFAKWIEYFIKEFGVRMVGGCCGTTAEHIAEVLKCLSAKVPKLKTKNLSTYAPTHLRTGFVSSLYSTIQINQSPPPLIVGERMNINGSKEFREYILADNFDAAAGMAKRQAERGAHVLDLSVAYAGRDEIKDMHEMARRLATASPLPLMIDSTSPEAIEAALSHLGGRSIINSINLEDGGIKAEKVIAIARQHGAALVALTIDEEGMALTATKKIAIAKRLIKLCKGLTVFIDLLTFTLAEPKAAEFGSGRETLRAIKLLKKIPPYPPLQRGEIHELPPLQRGEIHELPHLQRGEIHELPHLQRGEIHELPHLQRGEIHELPPLKKGGRGGFNHRTILGVSNISFGFRPEARKVLNSIFLYEAVKAGLDAAIVHAGQVLPLHKIEKQAAKLALDLIYCKRPNALQRFTQYFESGTCNLKHETKGSRIKNLEPRKMLQLKIIDGNKEGLEKAIRAVLKNVRAEEIINKVLLPAMQTVGEKFGNNELPLPFVLQSAEVMRAAVDLLKPHLKAGEAASRGTIVLATVRGDVHDIGKNLVDIILSNNGYKVINLGVKQPAHEIIEAALKYKADAIGLSGLIVQSCMVMKEDLAEMAHREIKIPVICGGAALTRKYVENDLQKAYGGTVHYARDAFDGLKIMSVIASGAKQSPANNCYSPRKTK